MHHSVTASLFLNALQLCLSPGVVIGFGITMPSVDDTTATDNSTILTVDDSMTTDNSTLPTVTMETTVEANYTEACWDVCWPYNGTMSVTETGKQCQSWSSQEPHQHVFNNNSWFPGETLDTAANYCREPMGDTFKPWCYTMDPKKVYEYCTIPLCNSNNNSTETSQKFKCDRFRCDIDRSHCGNYDPCVKNPDQCRPATPPGPSLGLALGVIIGTMVLFSMIGAAWFIVLCLADKREKKARDGETEENFYGDSESQDIKSISGKEVKDGTPDEGQEGQGEGQSPDKDGENGVQKRPPLTPKQQKQLKEIEAVGQYLKEIF